jgi:hypothetical protein
MRAAAVVAFGLGLVGLVAVSCVPSLPSFYTCTNAGQCSAHGSAGFCELPQGACSFPDSTCMATGKRYGTLDAPPFAGQCVEVGGDLAGVVVGDGGGTMSDLAHTPGSGSISRPGAGSLPPGNHGATVTLMKPSQVIAGDLLIASIFADVDTITVAPPAGWTTSADLSGGVNGATGVFRATWFYHFAGASEPASYDFQLSASPDTSAGGIVDYRGVATPPVDVGTSQLFEGTTFIAPSITTTHPNDYLVAMFVDGSPMSGVTWTAPAGMNSAVNNGAIGMFDQLQAVAGASGTRQAIAGLNVPGIGAVDFIALTAAAP